MIEKTMFIYKQPINLEVYYQEENLLVHVGGKYVINISPTIKNSLFSTVVLICSKWIIHSQWWTRGLASGSEGYWFYEEEKREIKELGEGKFFKHLGISTNIFKNVLMNGG